MTTIDPVTLEESYAVATQTTNLRVDLRKRMPVDRLMAAAMVKQGQIAGYLWHLQIEFDEARGDASLALRNHASLMTRVRQIELDITKERKRKTPDHEKIISWTERIAELRIQADHRMKQHRAFVLLKLPSLASVRQAFNQWALARSYQRSFRLVPFPTAAEFEDPAVSRRWSEATVERDRVVFAIANRVLEALIDPLCHRCEGRGFNGGYDGKPQVFKCKHCNSGRRKVNTRDAEEDAMAAFLHLEALRKMDDAHRLMRGLLQ